jgi:hypothetical protein
MIRDGQRHKYRLNVPYESNKRKYTCGVAVERSVTVGRSAASDHGSAEICSTTLLLHVLLLLLIAEPPGCSVDLAKKGMPRATSNAAASSQIYEC